MKKLILIVLGLVLSFTMPLSAKAYDFGDNRSVTLTTKAWGALDQGDIEAVLAFTNKCIELYSEQAKAMQAALKGYVKDSKSGGSDKAVFEQWALNDVGTCYFIQGEAYLKAKMEEEAKEAYKTVIDKYSYAQCWDSKGWFWKPAEAAKEKVLGIESGNMFDFGDYRSETLTTRAWNALNTGGLDAVIVYTNKCIDLYKDKAKEMQASLKEYPWGETKEKEKENVFKYWALNDVGTCLFIQGSALRKMGKNAEAKAVFQKIINEYSFAQCWDTQGWFWKPADGAREQITDIEATSAKK